MDKISKRSADHAYDVSYSKARGTLWKIAHHHHTSIQHLVHMNPSIKNPNLIYIGQRLKNH